MKLACHQSNHRIPFRAEDIVIITEHLPAISGLFLNDKGEAIHRDQEKGSEF